MHLPDAAPTGHRQPPRIARSGAGRWTTALASAALVVGLLAGCTQPTVKEELLCTLHGNGTSELSFEVSFPEALPSDADEAYVDRVEALRRAYAEGWDPWARRFEEAGEAGETLSWERVGGRLKSLTRTVRLETPDDLAAFFADTDLTVQFDADPEASGISIFPGSSSRATRNQRDRLDDLLEGWSRAVVAYLGQAADLYAQLDVDPVWAEPVFRAIFEDDTATDSEDNDLTPALEESLDRLIEAFVAVLEVAEKTGEDGETLERLARLVYDPFPAEITVSIAGRVLSVEGFTAQSAETYSVPPLGLEQALRALEARWVEPPLLTTYERIERLGEQAGFDLVEFAGRPRRVARLPTADEVSAAVRDALEPEAQYRIVWRPAAELPAAEPSSTEQRR